MAATQSLPGRATKPSLPDFIPFRQAARRRYRTLNVTTGAAFALGGQFTIDMPHIGYLETIYLGFHPLTATLGGAGALTWRGAHDVISLLECRVNTGQNAIFSAEGFWNPIIQGLYRRRLNPLTLADANLYAAALLQAANVWQLTWMIPVAANYGKNFGAGLINLQAPEVQVQVSGRYVAAGATIVSNFTSFVGTLTAGYSYYEVPPEKINGIPVEQPVNITHRMITQQQVVAAAGDQRVDVLREGQLARLAHVLVINDARNDVATQFRLVANNTDELYRLDNRWEAAFQDCLRISDRHPAGTYVHDLFAAEGEVQEGDSRDFINAEKLAQLQSILNTAAPAGTDNLLCTLREFFQVLR